MSYSRDTPIRGPSLGSPDAIAAWAVAKGASRPDDVRSYLATMHRLCASHGLAFHVAIAQSIHETTDQGIPWNSYWWRGRCNPAGIGITGDTRQNAVSRDFQTGDAAARAQFLHLWLYCVGDQPPTGLSTSDDPRWSAAIDAGFAGIATTLDDLTNRWAADSRYGDKIARTLNELDDVGLLAGAPEVPDMALTFHRVPMYGFVDKTYISKNKVEGVGWDNLGKRKPKFITLHRMLGSLNSTESFFAPPRSPHLTDFAIGVSAIDGAKRAGEIHQYNDPLGYKSGWASGPYRGAWGDGKRIGDKYGINAVNRDGISMEISGYQKTPIDDFAWSELVWFCAWWIDFMEIPYTALPKNPHTGINVLIWHQEFTLGSGKECPFEEVMERTDELYRDAGAFLQPYQMGATGQPETPPAQPEPPKPLYARPMPIKALADATTEAEIAAVVVDEANRFTLVNDRVRIIRRTPRRQTAPNGPSTGPDLMPDEEADVTWLILSADGNEYYVTDYWTRIKVADTVRISDTKGSTT